MENPLRALARLYQEQLRICIRMELLADSLRGRIDIDECRQLAADIRCSMSFLHSFEEEVFHPLLAERARDRNRSRRTFARLSEEHYADQGFADEIVELLSRLVEDAGDVDPERGGYMLRGFFESVRRHTRFEMDHVLQQARDVLSTGDLARLGKELEAYRMTAPVACTTTRVRIRNRRLV